MKWLNLQKNQEQLKKTQEFILKEFKINLKIMKLIEEL